MELRGTNMPNASPRDTKALCKSGSEGWSGWLQRPRMPRPFFGRHGFSRTLHPTHKNYEKLKASGFVKAKAAAS